MNKDTSEMLKELEACADFNAFYEENSDMIATKKLSENLAELLQKHNLKKSEVIKRCELNEIYAYQIFAGSRMPDRNKLLCIAIAMELDFNEIQLLLRSSGYAMLYVKDPFDCVVAYGIHKNLNILKINDILYDYGLNTLG